MTNMYETWLMEQIHSIANFPYEDIKILDKYPLDVSKQVLKVLIENSCLGQNYGPIDISRKKINEINKDWLNQFLLECKLRSNGMPVPLLRNGYSIFNGTKYR